MKPTINDKLIAYLALISGLAISGVAEYYSIMGLIAIYPAALIPIIIMGVVLGLGKISGTVWLKQNWEWSPFFLKAYVLPAIVVLMMITSLGVFGFLSKAHSDQSLVSGDVQSKIAVYDTKIQTARENIETDRKQLKQMDEAVDQVMGRSSDEKGADKANAIRKSQQRDRLALAKDIEANQKLISQLNDEAAPIRAEVRKVEAEVGPIKYIAHLLYGENPDANVLEKAVIWVTVLIVIVLDPLAVILLLASQYSFQRFREQESDVDLLHNTVEHTWLDDQAEELTEAFAEKSTADEILQAGVTNSKPEDNVPVAEEEYAIEKSTPNVEYKILEDVDEEPDTIPVVNNQLLAPITRQVEEFVDTKPEPIRTVITGNRASPVTKIFKAPPATLSTITEAVVQSQLEDDQRHFVTDMGNGYIQVDGQMYHEGSIPPHIQGYIQNEEQRESGVWSAVKKNEE
jgi:energy-converting hydrogenase Eha subunit A